MVPFKRVVCPKCKKDFEAEISHLKTHGYQFVPCIFCGYPITLITKKHADKKEFKQLTSLMEKLFGIKFSAEEYIDAEQSQ